MVNIVSDGADLTAIAVCLIVFVGAPWVVFHYITQWRKTRGLSAQDEQMLQRLYDSARKLEDRIVNLERALDTDRRI